MAVREIVRNARKNDGVPQTAQQSIPFDRMFPDGICRVGLDYYTKTVQFQDINYQLAQQEDKTEIFEEWCAFLNFFDSSVKFQLSFENMATDVSDFEKSIKISHKNDGFDDVRDEYSEVLLHQMEAGNNGLTKTKYLTFGINAESMKTAKPRLIHIETDILNNFKRLGVQAKSLNGRSIVEKPLTRDQIKRIKERMLRAEPKESVLADLNEKKKETARVPKKQGPAKEKGER